MACIRTSISALNGLKKYYNSENDRQRNLFEIIVREVYQQMYAIKRLEIIKNDNNKTKLYKTTVKVN